VTPFLVGFQVGFNDLIGNFFRRLGFPSSLPIGVESYSFFLPHFALAAFDLFGVVFSKKSSRF